MRICPACKTEITNENAKFAKNVVQNYLLPSIRQMKRMRMLPIKLMVIFRYLKI